jgi:hypothetical protein
MLDWRSKYRCLQDVVTDLYTIQYPEFLHDDLHGCAACVHARTHFSVARRVDEDNGDHPESDRGVLQCGTMGRTAHAGFGYIENGMWEFLNECRVFDDRSHDANRDMQGQ